MYIILVLYRKTCMVGKVNIDKYIKPVDACKFEVSICELLVIENPSQWTTFIKALYSYLILFCWIG